YLILVVVIGLALGPMGRLGLNFAFVPNLWVVFLWASAWFKNQNQALRLATVGGLLLDLASFHYFGLWTALSLMIVMIIAALKSRYLDSASLTHSLLALALVSIFPLAAGSIITHTFLPDQFLLGIFGNIILGGIVYYGLAMRLK